MFSIGSLVILRNTESGASLTARTVEVRGANVYLSWEALEAASQPPVCFHAITGRASRGHCPWEIEPGLRIASDALPRRPRGFAAMSETVRKEIAAEGGRVAHAGGGAHEWTSEEAARAGRVGGKLAHERKRAHEWTSETAREAGKRGGKSPRK